MTDNYNSDWILVKGENEKMVEGENVVVLAIDQHKQHIVSHRGILSDPDLRKDPDLVQRVLGHIQDHIKALQTTDPNLLLLLGEQSLAQGAPPPQPGGPPPPQQAPHPGPRMQGPNQHTQAGMTPPPGPGAKPGPGQVMQGAAPQGPPKPPIMPAMPQPPAPFKGTPTGPTGG